MKTRTANRIGKAVLVLVAITASLFVLAQRSDPDEQQTPPMAIVQPMTANRLGELIVNVDGNAALNGSTWFFHVAELETVVVYDIDADRMRIMIPVGPVGNIEKEELLRLMQANFDSALDARYAIAQDTLWGAFIHPLSTLTDEEFLVGLGQTANVVMSFGTSYSSGLFIFGSGDSAEIERKRLIEELKKTTTT